VCPWNAKFSLPLREDAFRPRAAIAGRDARTLEDPEPFVRTLRLGHSRVSVLRMRSTLEADDRVLAELRDGLSGK
jgi:hypothetical protein